MSQVASCHKRGSACHRRSGQTGTGQTGATILSSESAQAWDVLERFAWTVLLGMVRLHSAPCLRTPALRRCGVAESRSCGAAPSRRSGATRSSSHAPSKRCGVAGSTSPADIIGDVTETDAQHRKRHPSIRSDCPRCQHLRYGPKWEKHYGSHRSEADGKRTATVWLAPRPRRLGGLWGLGCIFCARWAQQQADRKSASRAAGVVLPKRGRGARDGQTKWARFEIRSLTQVAMRGVSQHAQTLMHRKATRAYFIPEPSVIKNT